MTGFEVPFATVILSFHTVLIVNPLWMDQLSWNWWRKCRIFDTQDDYWKILDRYDAQKCIEAPKVKKKTDLFFCDFCNFDLNK